MAKTRYYNWVGTMYWAKLDTPDSYNGAKKWTLNFFPESDEVWNSIRESGVKLTATDPETKLNKIPLAFAKKGMFIRPRRDTEKRIKDQMVEFEPPIVTDAAGAPITVAFKNNGSKVEINCSVFGEGTYTGHRLERVKVLELMETEAPNKDEASPEVEEPKAEVKGKLPKVPF